MKKIILPIEHTTISLDHVTNEMFIGFIQNDKKVMIVPKNTPTNNTIYNMMDCDFKISCTNANSKKELLLKIVYKEAFVFDTKKEIVTWLFNF